MEQNKNEFETQTGCRAWMRRHKKGLIIGGCTLVACAMGGIIGYRYKDAIIDGLQHIIKPNRVAMVSTPVEKLPITPVIDPLERVIEGTAKREYEYHIDRFDVSGYYRRGRNGQPEYVNGYTKHPNAA